MLMVPRIGLVLLVAVALAGCYESPPDLRDEVEWHDGEEIFRLLLTEPRFKEVADRVAPFTIRVDVHVLPPGEPLRHDYAYRDGIVTNASAGNADFTLTTSRDVALAVLNADDGFRVFACAMNANAATFEANNMLHAASFNGARGRLLESADDCTAKPGDKVTFRDLSGTLVEGSKLNRHMFSPEYAPLLARMYMNDFPVDDLLAYNEWRAPTRWIDDTYGFACRATGADGQPINICANVGTSAPSSALADCAAKVQAAYADEPPAEGWDAGVAAARAANKAAEEALCQLVFRGV